MYFFFCWENKKYFKENLNSKKKKSFFCLKIIIHVKYGGVFYCLVEKSIKYSQDFYLII